MQRGGESRWPPFGTGWLIVVPQDAPEYSKTRDCEQPSTGGKDEGMQGSILDVVGRA